ncbi:ribonuclease domain-containing protein [Thioalkalicoccus limnaeus]|uniref:Ribonuclease domain-containing protein n=1 Tax=Thioalkalicoccus limnaeus TaxID=120681 RepID=A0ABV4BF23_9GAMM
MIKRLALIGILVLGALIGYPYLSGLTGLDGGVIEPPSTRSESPSALVVQDVKVYDLDGRLAFHGDVDLTPELARIERGEPDPHRNDGSVFQNRERLLPIQERGYYREYVVRTPGIRHAGPQRLVIGAGGEVYYTADHYRSFTRIR